MSLCAFMLAGEIQLISQQPPQTPAPAKSPESEISASNPDSHIKVRVNLVLVRVVARDGKGNIVPGLKKEDFQILDDGKLQTISTFSVETPETQANAAPAATVEAVEANKAAPEKPADSPAPPALNPSDVAITAPPANRVGQRYVALVFDDLRTQSQDALALHAATEKLFTSLAPTDRVAIYSTSGKVNQDFTNDLALLRKTVTDIAPHGNRGEGQNTCPSLSYFQADLIENKHDPYALQAANADASLNCHLIQADVIAAADRVLNLADMQTREAYQALTAIVRRMTSLPGQRVMVLVSPGYGLGTQVQSNDDEFVDRAMRAAVVINVIDARALYNADILRSIDAAPDQNITVDASGRAHDGPTVFDFQSVESSYRMQSQMEQGTVLQGLAASTGGTFFHNRNDLDTGMNQAINAPAVSYILGFSPQNLKIDGKFHKLKVTIVTNPKYQLQSRNGYYAPKVLADPQEMAKQEVREALFSQDEIIDLPVELKTQFFKVDATSTQLTVLTHLDVRKIHFRKADGRNYDNVVLATGIFDDNGKFIDGQMREIALKLQDSTMQRLSATGFTIKIVFTVKPGTYLVRSVVRGSQDEQLTARNTTAVIPQ